MAISKILLAPLVISLGLMHLAESDMTTEIKTMMESVSPSPSPFSQKIDCDGACNQRCRLSSRPRLCKLACGACCEKCNCVPSGTYDHYEECPCYANLTTRRG